MMRPAEDVDRVVSLVAAGVSDREVSRITGIPRTTVRDWRHGVREDTMRRRTSRGRCPGAHDVSMYSKRWVCLFPQHGAGRKHERPIRLEPWQEQFVAQDAEGFVRGLDTQRRMPRGRGRSWCEERSVSVLEPIGGHQEASLQLPGRTRYPLDSPISSADRRLREGRRRAARRVHRAQSVDGLRSWDPVPLGAWGFGPLSHRL